MDCDKYDVHRHMGGAISPKTVAQIMVRDGQALSIDSISQSMICSRRDIGFPSFLNKFKILDDLNWSSWAIDLAVSQICRDLADEGVHYCGISIAIDKYVRKNQWKPKEVVLFLSDCFEQHSKRNEVSIDLLLSLGYGCPRTSQMLYGDLIKDDEVASRLCGIDLTGDENFFNVEFYKPIFDNWRSAGKILRAHVGEMPGTANNVYKAIEILGANRIAHGIQSSSQTLQLAAERDVYFDLALHSNLATGATINIKQHPLKRMLKHGCKITLNTDDPVQFQCTLDDEFELAIQNDLIDNQQAEILMQNAREMLVAPNL